MTRFCLTPLRTAWLIPLALLAVVVWLRRFNRYLPELMLFGTPLAVTLVFWFSPRYRLPAIPVIVVGSAWVLRQAWHERTRRRWPVAVGLALAVGIGLGLLNRAIGFDRLTPSLRAQFRHTVAVTLARTDRIAEAAQWCRKALELNPQYAPAHANLGAALAELGKPEEGLEQLWWAVRAEPENPTFHGQLAVVLREQGQLEEATRQFRSAVELNPDNAALRVNLGNALFTNGEPAAAIRQYEQALRVDPTYALAHYNMGRVLSAQHDATLALQHLVEAVRFDPNLAEAPLLAAKLLLTQGHSQAALQTLREAHQRMPQNYVIANDLAWHLATLPDLAAADRAMAVSLAQQVVAQLPEPSANELDTLAAAFAATGQFKRAVQTIENALALATRQGTAANVDSYRARLELYESNRPYVAQPATSTAPASQPDP
jgi:tetratricopeptide (TPR) repeat protein